MLVLVSNIWRTLLIDQEEKQVLCTCMVEVEHVYEICKEEEFCSMDCEEINGFTVLD